MKFEDLINLTPVLEALLVLISALITRYLVPWIKKKLTMADRENILFAVELAVKAAQQYGKNFDWTGEQKKQYVISYLAQNGFQLDINIDNYIEAMVLDVKNQLMEE